MGAAKNECERLLGELMPFAEQCLTRYREFFPFGATMSQSGEIVMTAATDGREHPPSDDLIALFIAGFRNGAQAGEYKATGIAFDALTIPPGRDVKQDTIVCTLDHQDNYSIKVCFPYKFDLNDQLVVEDPYAVEGEYKVFGKSTV